MSFLVGLPLIGLAVEETSLCIALFLAALIVGTQVFSAEDIFSHGKTG